MVHPSSTFCAVLLASAAAFRAPVSVTHLTGRVGTLRASEAPAEGSDDASSTSTAAAAGATAAAGAGVLAAATTAAGTACAGGVCAVGAGAAATAAGGVGASGGRRVGSQDAFRSDHPVVLEFYSDNCPHCREAARRLYDVEVAHAGDVDWVMVDTQNEANRPLWEKLGVDEIPHFSFLDASKTLARTEIGPISAKAAEAGIAAIAPAR
ncbi:thioredoxin-like protein [Aureococcus anophagefferens]|uniref:Thioredoxin-like protein n=1 Tax=Aureococcus anophagefferens TaxID=44056 RepID=A0ABR1FIH2_AURAN